MEKKVRRINRITTLLLAFMMIAVSCLHVYAEGEGSLTTAEKVAALRTYNWWVVVDGGKYYYNSNGNLIRNGWAKLRSYNKQNAAVKWCYFDKNGLCRKTINAGYRNNWIKANGRIFYFDKYCRPVGTGFRMIDNKLYFFDKNRSLVIGTFTLRGQRITTTRQGNITGLLYYKYKYQNGKFVYIDISDQRLQYYRYGKLELKCPVVTGRTSRGWGTPTGNYRVRYKARSTYLRGSDYETYVNYWIAFIGNEYGIHDATWRRTRDFRDPKAYRTRGSHGCVNMQLSDAARLYRSVSVGTPVIIEK